MPDKFLHILDETGLIYDVGEWVLRESIKELIKLRSDKNIFLKD